jgi:cyanophycinase-like exopeptidase
VQDWNLNARGIGVSEKTAVCIDEKGMATVFGQGVAYFLQAQSISAPETCVEKQPLHWKRAKKAVRVYAVEGSANGHGQIDLTEKTPNGGGTASFWFVENGTLLTN